MVKSRLLARPALLFAASALALSLGMSGCDQHANPADQAAASHQLNKAASDLKSAAKATDNAITDEANSTKPALKQIGAEADRDAGKLADAAGDAAAKAGDALNSAAARADAAAHRAGDNARNHADKAGGD